MMASVRQKPVELIKGREKGTPHGSCSSPAAGNGANQPTMTFNLNFRAPGLESVLLRPGGVRQDELSASRLWLRRFILLKLVTVLLFPRGAVVPTLLGCASSLGALSLLRSPRLSTKPSTVFLAQLALADVLVPVTWGLRAGATLAGSWDGETGLAEKGERLWWGEASGAFCQRLLDTHHLASLLLLGLLGLEATLVSRWPQQTRRLRTARRAQLGCSLVWMLALVELGLSLRSTPQSIAPSGGATAPRSVPSFSPCLRRMLWLANLWLHSYIYNSKASKRRSSFH